MFNFGPSGRPEGFNRDYKESYNIPQWIYDNGLDAFEYPFTKMMNIGQEKAEKIGQNAKRLNIKMSIHAPYSIDITHPEDERRNESIQELFRGMIIAGWLGADRVVFHPGRSTGDEEKDLRLLKENMEMIMEHYYQFNFKHIYLCPEVMGKINHTGSIDQIISLCDLAPEIIPTLDFGHIHGRYNGFLKKEDDFREILKFIQRNLSQKKLQQLHIHFTKVEFGSKGEIKHRSYEEEGFGPKFDHLAKLLIEYQFSGRVISESRRTMLEDSITMKKIYHAELKKQIVMD